MFVSLGHSMSVSAQLFVTRPPKIPARVDKCNGDVTPVIAVRETNGHVLMPHRRMRGKMTAYGKLQSAAEALRPLALRCQRHLHLQ
jgi:hypothetical protein